ncbi:MAG: hypothetical protein OXC57_03790 [Rhodobacteraceae bacterium]|nr:hypothetical protein [Paracoccaceae bacterium]
MNQIKLFSKEDAEEALAEVLNINDIQGIPDLYLEVKEDKCLSNWVKVGKVQLFPDTYIDPPLSSQGPKQKFIEALRAGFFEWYLPEKEDLRKEIEGALNQNKKPNTEKDVNEICNAVVHIAMKCGMAFPIFDAMALGLMQTKKPFSIVADTSSVLQGGIDFFEKHTSSSARIKIPALVHMEILNFVDRYFKQRYHDNPNISRMLVDHIRSQGGQRVLLRLEVNNEIEVERPRLGADPLRGIISISSDTEDKNLGLQVVQRSFADRLILETAVQHLNLVDPGHQVYLLTSDQGLARMALAENIKPIFFDSNEVNKLFGKSLSGIGFTPFTNDSTQLYHVPLMEILWELAINFGSSCVTNDSGEIILEIIALGQEVSWQPYHSTEDFLWGKKGKLENKIKEDKQNFSNLSKGPSLKLGSYSFSVKSMLKLIERLYKDGKGSDNELMSFLNISTNVGFGGYLNFLLSGEFVERKGRSISKLEKLDRLYLALNAENYQKIKNLLITIESFCSFIEKIKVGEGLQQEDSDFKKGIYTSFSNLADISCLGVRFVDKGVYSTPNIPSASDFAITALEAYEQVRKGEDFALTGTWLEKLIIQYGIHPVMVRNRLAEGHQAGYLKRYFEGSTPDTSFENRSILALENDQYGLGVRQFKLYHGDFLLPGRASVSLKLVKGEQ